MHKVMVATRKNRQTLKNPITIYIFSLFNLVWHSGSVDDPSSVASIPVLCWAAAETTKVPSIGSRLSVVRDYPVRFAYSRAIVDNNRLQRVILFFLVFDGKHLEDTIMNRWLLNKRTSASRFEEAECASPSIFTFRGIFFLSHLCCPIDSNALTSPSLFVVQDSSVVCIMDMVSSAVLSLT